MENAAFIAEELSESLHAILQCGQTQLQTSEMWSDVVESVNEVCAMKVKEHPGLSSKGLFKHMDIRDMLES